MKQTSRNEQWAADSHVVFLGARIHLSMMCEEEDM